MKKWIPYIIGLLIPVMIFVSFTWMIKKRTFVFRDEFVKQGSLLVEKIESDFQLLLNRDAIQKINKIEVKLQENKDDTVNLFLKNLAVDSIILDNLFITDNDLNLKFFFDKNTLAKISGIKEAVKAQPVKEGFNAVYVSGGYYVYKSTPGSKIFISINTGFFQKILKEKYPFMQNSLNASQKNWYFNFSEADFKKYHDFKDLARETEAQADNGKKAILELKGDYVFGKKAYLTENGKELFNLNFFVYIHPAQYPMSLWHRVLLVINAILVLVMFLMLLFKIKNESILRQMDDYSDENEDFLERNPITVYESESEHDEPAIDVIDDDFDTEEEYLEIPDEYFKKEDVSVKRPNQELTNIISEVKDHEEEVHKYTSLWKNILGIVNNPDAKMMLGLVGEEDDQVIAHFQKNLEADSPLNLSINNWVIENYTLAGKAIWITEDALKASPIKQIFPFEYQLDSNSVFIAPVRNEENEIRGIFLLFSADKFEKEIILEINSLIRMG